MVQPRPLVQAGEVKGQSCIKTDSDLDPTKPTQRSQGWVGGYSGQTLGATVQHSIKPQFCLSFGIPRDGQSLVGSRGDHAMRNKGNNEEMSTSSSV